MQFFSVASLVITGIMVHDRQQTIDLNPLLTSNPLPGLKYLELSPSLTILSVTFTRISICFFLLRIVAAGQRWKARTWKWGLYFIMILNVWAGVPIAIITACQCRPVRKLWNPILPGTCLASSVIIGIGDFYGGKISQIKPFTDIGLGMLTIC